MTTKHAEKPKVPAGDSRVRNKGSRKEEVLEVYDATPLVGLKTKVYNAAVRRVGADGEEMIEVPKLDQLIASAAVARCLMPIKLRGREIKAMRRIIKKTMAELAQTLGEKTAAETIARWESEAQPMGGYAEKVLRLVICEELVKDTPGVEYAAGVIAHLQVMDPWLTDPDYEVPYMEFRMVGMKKSASDPISCVYARAA